MEEFTPNILRKLVVKQLHGRSIIVTFAPVFEGKAAALGAATKRRGIGNQSSFPDIHRITGIGGVTGNKAMSEEIHCKIARDDTSNQGVERKNWGIRLCPKSSFDKASPLRNLKWLRLCHFRTSEHVYFVLKGACFSNFLGSRAREISMVFSLCLLLCYPSRVMNLPLEAAHCQTLSVNTAYTPTATPSTSKAEIRQVEPDIPLRDLRDY